jgi:hypothetical protein
MPAKSPLRKSRQGSALGLIRIEGLIVAIGNSTFTLRRYLWNCAGRVLRRIELVGGPTIQSRPEKALIAPVSPSEHSIMTAIVSFIEKAGLRAV